MRPQEGSQNQRPQGLAKTDVFAMRERSIVFIRNSIGLQYFASSRLLLKYAAWTLLFFLAIAQLVAKPVTAQETTDKSLLKTQVTVSDSEVTAEFEAFIDSVGSSSKAGSVILKKWQDPIRYYVDGGSAESSKLIDDLFSTFASASGHQAMRTRVSKDANFFFVFDKEGSGVRERYDFLIDRFAKGNSTGALVIGGVIENPRDPCVALHRDNDSRTAIDQAAIFFIANVVRQNRMESCITLNLASSIGLLGAKQSKHSIKKISNTDFSWEEKSFIEILYHPSIQSGSSASDVAEQISSLLKQLPVMKLAN